MANPINIIGGFYKDDTLSWACQDTVNYLPTQAEVSGTKTPSMLRTPPGLRPWVKIGDGPNFAIRGMHDAEGRLFVVSGSKLYQISNKGVAIPLGTIPGRGRVSIAHNQIAGGNEILVVNGNSGYVWNTLKQTFTRITDPGYPGAFQAVFADGYLIQAEPFGRFLFHSNLADALDYNTLDRFEAESEPDKIVAVVVSNDEVRVFGERTTQLFANTGAAQGTFQSKGITINRGCAGRWTALAMDNAVFFLGDDGVVYRDNGYSPVRISTYAIEQAIADNDWSQAFAFAWENRGHSVYYLTFPDGQTWGYDVSSGAWHRRASYHPVYEVSRRWRLNDLVYSNGQWIGGDSTSGKLFVLDWDYMLEDEGTELVSERSTQIAYADGAPFSVDMIDLIARTGSEITGSVFFSEQPEGPKISGDAPNGAVGLNYENFVYTNSAGDSPVVSSSVISGELPPGFVYNGATHTISQSGQTMAGKYTFTIRDSDENGLWAEVTDTIEIDIGPVLALGLVTEGGDSYISESLTGNSWVDAFLPSNIGFAGRIYGISGFRFLAIPSGGTSARYSDDKGRIWAITTLVHSAGHYNPACVLSGVVLVPGEGGINRSTNNALSWSSVGGSNSYNCIAGHDELVVTLTAESRPSYSLNKGLTWSALGPRLDTDLSPPLSFQYCAETDGKRIAFGGSSVDGQRPCVVYTDDGVTFINKFVSNEITYVNTLRFGKIGGKSYWLAGCGNGKIYRSEDGCKTWDPCIGSLSVIVADIVFNGIQFIAGGGTSGITEIKTSLDADNFTLRPSPLSQTIRSIAQGRA